MKVVAGFLFLTSLFKGCISGSSEICPGSNADKHAKCSMTVTFPSASCSVVSYEILSRLRGLNGWIDPHNQGTYELLEEDKERNQITASRLTGDRKYTDKFQFGLTEIDGKTDACEVTACSESQVRSVIDYSTNYCNLRSLYCNSSDGCPVVASSLEYEETYSDCTQRDAKKCIADSVH